jgi:hypothetical protein
VFFARYSAVHGLRPVDELAVLVAGPTVCCEVAKGVGVYILGTSL